MEYIKAAKTDEFVLDQTQLVTIKDRQIMLIYVEGSYYAVDNKCPHMGGSLNEGNIDGYNIICPRHGSGFDVRTGKLTVKGKLAFFKINTADIRTYPVKVEGQDILIGIE